MSKKTDKEIELAAVWEREVTLLPEHLSPILPKTFKIIIGTNLCVFVTVAGNDITDLSAVDRHGTPYPKGAVFLHELYTLKQYQKDTTV